MQSIALANQKGGVGKTTTAIHLAHGLALMGSRVCLVDLDPQGNAAVALQGMHSDSGKGHDLVEVTEGLSCLSLHVGTSALPQPTLASSIRERAEAAAVDWLIADCPPRMDEWGRLGLELCDQVIVPVQAEFLAMHGLSQIMETIRSSGGTRLRGVLVTMVSTAEQISGEVVANLKSHLGSMVFETMILRDARVVEAASHGKTVFTYSPGSKAGLCYGEFIREVFSG